MGETMIEFFESIIELILGSIVVLIGLAIAL